MLATLAAAAVDHHAFAYQPEVDWLEVVTWGIMAVAVIGAGIEYWLTHRS